MENKKQKILNVIDDTVGRFLYYDRKEDEELEVDEIEKQIEAGNITSNEIINRFKIKLEIHLTKIRNKKCQ